MLYDAHNPDNEPGSNILLFTNQTTHMVGTSLKHNTLISFSGHSPYS
jgi:hypothetical protein